MRSKRVLQHCIDEARNESQMEITFKKSNFIISELRKNQLSI